MYVLQVSILRMDEFKPEEFAQLITGFRNWDYHPGEEFLKAFCVIFARDMEKYGPRAVSTCIVALAHFAYRDLQVLEAIRKYAQSRDFRSSHRLIFDFAWSLSILNGLNEDMVRWILGNTSKVASRITSKEKRQFYQFLLSVHVLNPRLVRYLLFPESFENECFKHWKINTEKHQYTYKAILDAFSALRELGFICERNEPSIGNRFMVHTIRHKSLSQVFALEIGGGFHNAPSIIRGSRIWRRRSLQALGFTVLSVDEVEWNRLTTVEMRREYLKRRIKNCADAAKHTRGRGG